MNAIDTANRGKESTYMKTFTIDADNNISVFANPAEAAATTTPFDTFASQKELAELASAWTPERLVAVWNSLPGVKPVKTFKSAKTAAGRIWECIQTLGEAPKQKAKGGAPVPNVVPAQGKATKKATPAKKAAKSKKDAPKPTDAREGSKKANVVAMLQRKNGATLAEIMKATDWQAHTVRGFISGTLGKKMGLKVASVKNEAGERTYSLPR